MTRKFFVGGNWKMNGSQATNKGLVEALNSVKFDNVEVVVSPPFIYLDAVRKALRPEIELAAQNIHTEKSGAFTGEISAEMLKDINVNWVIIGHSERRQYFAETDDLVGKKTAKALATGLKVIACIGETGEERKANKTQEVVYRQLAGIAAHVKDWTNVVIAYEPVWAIGTGVVATPAQAQDVHKDIRKWLADKVSQQVSDQTRIIYGGSVNAANSKELGSQGDVDGFLVGGASLKPEFGTIIQARV